LIAAVATDTDQQAVRHGKKRTHVASKKPDADTKDAPAKDTAKDAKPVKHANAKPDAAPKSADTAGPAKPAKPKTAAKPAGKPAPKNTGGNDKPAG
jgi:D-alanyl-D-alanine carboxypeptidase